MHSMRIVSYVLFGGKVRTISLETAPQIALRSCSKEVEGRSVVILVKQGYMQSSTYFSRRFCLSQGAVVTMKDSGAFLDMRRSENCSHKISS